MGTTQMRRKIGFMFERTTETDAADIKSRTETNVIPQMQARLEEVSAGERTNVIFSDYQHKVKVEYSPSDNTWHVYPKLVFTVDTAESYDWLIRLLDVVLPDFVDYFINEFREVGWIYAFYTKGDGTRVDERMDGGGRP